MNPKISVVMSCYNRAEYAKLAIESILNQTYKDFEFIIFDDCSTDNTADIIQEYANKDERIVFIKNSKNMHYNYNLRKGFEIAKGEYIARMDDDDISMPERFAKQVEFLDSHPDITVLGSFIKIIGNEDAKVWVKDTEPDMLNIAMHFYNPMCHPSVMIRNSFLKKHNLNYSAKELYAEEYHLWKEIILRGGKLANLPEVLLEYRVHNKSVTLASTTTKIQDQTAERVRESLLTRYFNKKQVKKVRETIFKYPFENNNKKKLFDILEKMKNQGDLVSEESIIKFQHKYCGVPCTMEIFFASDNNFVQHLCTAMASILVNSLTYENFNFYILDGGISQKSKKNIENLKKIRNFNIEFIKVDDSLFVDCPITDDCKHISKQTYYRYIIPQLKPELEKCFYFDCDIVVDDSLNELWNSDLSSNYIAAVEELYEGAVEDELRLNVQHCFNAGVILINNTLWKQDNIPQKLFANTVDMQKQKLIRWVDQDVLNYTFNNNIKFVSPKFNLQCNAFYNGRNTLYTEEEMNCSKFSPVIIHFNSCLKPWNKNCQHPLWKKYYKYLKLTPYKQGYYQYKINKISKLIAKVFYRKKQVGNKTKVYVLGLPAFKKVKEDFIIKKYLFGIKIYSKQDFNAINNYFLSKLICIEDKLTFLEKKYKNIYELLKWQNYAISRLNYGQNTIFRYSSGLPICSENYSYERVIAFDLQDSPQDHRQRYLFAKNLILQSDEVLDIACGTGYGTAAIAKVSKNAVGVDIDKYAIDFAHKVFVERENIQNLSYLAQDIFVSDLGQYDKVISFETIEHIENDKLFVSKLYESLKNNGKLICSVPNESIFPFNKEENPFHIKHYTVQDFTELLESCGFIIEDIYFQYHEYGEKICKKTEKEGYSIICIAKKDV